MELNCIIVDDEPLALNLLEDYVNRTPFLKLVAKCKSGIEATAITEHIDIAFLDIQMPMLNGLELAKMLENCAIIFTTAFEQYAITGYKVNAIDYLLKPFSYAEFLTAADKALKYISSIRNTARDNSTNDAYIAIKSEYRQQIIPISSIIFVESIRDYVKIHTEEYANPIQTLMTLKSIEEMLPKSNFVRVHRSFIVNVNKIKVMERGNIVFGKTYIPISDMYRDAFNKLFQSRIINS